MVSDEVTGPSDNQLNYMKSLGYDGIMPMSVNEASIIIGTLKDGGSPKKAQKAMMKFRKENRGSSFNSCCLLIILSVMVILMLLVFGEMFGIFSIF